MRDATRRYAAEKKQKNTKSSLKVFNRLSLDLLALESELKPFLAVH